MAREQKVVSRRDILIAAVVLKQNGCQEHEALPDHQIKHQDAARQSRENITRIAPSGSFSIV